MPERDRCRSRADQVNDPERIERPADQIEDARQQTCIDQQGHADKDGADDEYSGKHGKWLSALSCRLAASS